MKSRNTLNKIILRRPLLIPIGVVTLLALALVGLISVSLAAPAPMAPLGESTLGDYVWHDTDYDGVQDAGEVGINGVVVNLYDDANYNCQIDAGEFMSSTTTTTNPDSPYNDGWYDFDVTAWGKQYIVEIDDSNFAPGGPLEGFVHTSAGTYGPEPMCVYLPDPIMDYNDADFGYARSEIEITKELIEPPEGYAVISDTVTFKITISNVGDVPIVTLPLYDHYNPACLGFLSADPAPNGPDTDYSMGTLHWSNLGPLGVGQQTVVWVNFHAQKTDEMYWKEGSWIDYAPKGMPDFDQKQDSWKKIVGNKKYWYYCGPVAAANSLWWFDSKFEPNPVWPPHTGMPGAAINDNYPLVPAFGNFDDHDPLNVDDPSTPKTCTPPQGELVEQLACMMGTAPGVGTTVQQMVNGLTQWINNTVGPDQYTVQAVAKPSFEWIEEEVRRSEDVILLLGFWQAPVPGMQALSVNTPDCCKPRRIGGHYVTVAGIDSENQMIAFSDPYRDNAEAGGPGRVLPAPHSGLHPGGTPDTVHNDAKYASHDVYAFMPTSTPGGDWGPAGYVNPDPTVGCPQIENFIGQNEGDYPNTQDYCDPYGAPLWTEVEYAIVVSPITETVMCDPTNNIAVVSGAIDELGNELPEKQTETEVHVVEPGIDLVKLAGTAPDGDIYYLSAPGDVTFTYIVTNTGDTYLSPIVIVDDNGTPGDPGDDFTVCTITAPLAPGASAQCQTTVYVDDYRHNLAEATGNPSDGAGNDLPGLPDVSDSDDAEVDIYAAIGDFVWEDVNGNGIQDAGEPGIDGVTVELYDSGDNLQDTTTTASGGFYSFTSLVPGDYYLKFILPGGYVFTFQDQGADDSKDSDANPADGKTIVTTLDSGEHDMTWDAGMYRPPSIGDYVWYDANGDGIQGVGESGIDGVTVELYDSGDNLQDTTTTAGGGFYSFTNLVPGDYYLKFILPPGYIFTLQDQGGDDSKDSDANPANGKTIVTTLDSGEHDMTWDAGMSNQDFGDLPDWYPTLLVQNGARHITGDVWMGQIVDAELDGQPTVQADGDDLLDGSDDEDGVVFLGSNPTPGGPWPGTSDKYIGGWYGGVKITVNAAPSAVGKTVYLHAWFDFDHDRDLGDDGENVFCSVPIEILDAGPVVYGPPGSGADVELPQLEFFIPQGSPTSPFGDLYARFRLDEQGLNEFEGLAINGEVEDYWLEFGQGSLDFGDAPDPTYPTLMASNGARHIIGSIWMGPLIDAEADGQPVDQDDVVLLDDEDGVTFLGWKIPGGGYAMPFIAGQTGAVQIVVTGGSGYVHGWIDWNQDGDWDDAGENVFCGYPVTPGANIIEFSVPSAAQGTQPGTTWARFRLDDDPNLNSPVGLAINGEVEDYPDVEVVLPGQLGDFVWWDVNFNGQQDAGEPGIPGVLVNLYDSNGVKIATDTTDNNGFYLFDGLTPDTYRIEIDASEFLPGGTLENWYASPQDAAGVPDDMDSDGDPNTHDVTTVLTAGEVDLTNDFGFDIVSDYVITKRLNTEEPVRPGEPVSFTIRITNTGDSWIGILPLRDVYDPTYLTYGYGGQFASPDSDDHVNDGQIDWSDLTVSFGTDLAPGASFTVIVTFTAQADTQQLPGGETEDTAIVHDAYADGDGPGPLGPEEPLPEKEDSDSVLIINPTGVALAEFSAAAQPDGVLITWQTASEVEILGFNVLRQTGDGEFEMVNEEFIFAEYAGADRSASYAYLDEGLPAGVYTYTLEIVKLDGRVERYGLARVVVGLAE